MDFVNKMTGGGSNENEQSGEGNKQSSGGGFLGGLGDKINSMAGGGQASEKNEEYINPRYRPMRLR